MHSGMCLNTTEYVFIWTHQSFADSNAHTASFVQAIMHPSIQAISIHYCHNSATDTVIVVLSTYLAYCVDTNIKYAMSMGTLLLVGACS